MEVVRNYRGRRARDLPRIFRRLCDAAGGVHCNISVRAKRTDAIVRKLARMGTMALTQMDDIVAARVLCASLGFQERLITALKDDFATSGAVRVKQYLRPARRDGYRAVHLIVKMPQVNLAKDGPANFSVELQIRTYFQHLWATMSESFGEQVKEGGGTKAERIYLRELSSKIESFETGHRDYVQKQMARHTTALCFQIISFAKKIGAVRDSTEFHESEIESALSYLTMLERRESDQSIEVVLLGASCDTDTLQSTHERYYRARGIPGLPDFLVPVMARPERATAPFA